MLEDTEVSTNFVSREDLEKLWRAANDHCVTLYGEWVPEGYEGDDCPPAPDSGTDLVHQVIQYFKNAG